MRKKLLIAVLAVCLSVCSAGAVWADEGVPEESAAQESDAMLISPEASAGLPDILSDNDLPVVNIVIDEDAEGYGTAAEMNESPDHSVRCTGTLQIMVPEGYTGDYSSTALSDTDELQMEYIRGRGNTTWNREKKPYKIKLEAKADLLGMGESKHWILLANDFDTTLMRNRIVSYIGTRLGLAYTPQMLPVDVVMNGEYLGSYCLAEQVRIGESRVEIDELTAEDNAEPEITGGYLLGYQPAANEPEENCFTTERGVGFLFDNPEFYSDDPDDTLGTAEQKAYISDWLQKTEDAVYNGSPEEYMDLQSVADYWWVQEFSLNVDAFRTTSTYLYKPRDGKLYWGPLWDFDLTFGRSISETYGFNQSYSDWLDDLRENNEDYKNLLKDRWKVLDEIITDIVKEGGVLDQYTEEIRASWEDNLPLTDSPYLELDDEVETLRTWMRERQEWINQNPDLLDHVHSTVSFAADGEEIAQQTIYTGAMLRTLPDAPEKENYIFLGWTCEGEKVDLNDPPVIWEDEVITAEYVSIDDAVLSENIFFESYEAWADVSSFLYYTMFVMIPEDTQEQYAAWSSSDDTVAEVNQEGIVSLKKTGDAEITATLLSGVSRTLLLHVYDGSETPAQEAETITLKERTIRMKTGEYAQIAASISPQPCTESLSFMLEDDGEGWEEDRMEIVQDLTCGVYRALSPGTVRVRVGAGEVAVLCTIIVEDDEPEPAPEPAVTAEPAEVPSATPAVIQPEETDADPPAAQAADTGDHSNAAGYLSLAAAALAALLILRRRMNLGR